MGNDGVVFLTVDFDGMFCPGHRSEFLVPKAVRATDLVLVWIHGEEVGWNFDPAQGILVDEFLGCLAGIMRGIERDVGEERILVGMLLRFLQKIDGIFGHDFTPVFPAFPKPLELRIVRTPRVGLSRKRAVVSCRRLVGHAPTHVTGNVEAFLGTCPDMPFAGHVGLVASSFHVFRPEAPFGSFGFRFFGCLLGSPDEASGVEHVSASHADRTTPGTHVVCPHEAGTRLHQSIEIGGLYIGYTEITDGLVALVVGKDEENVRLILGVKGACEGKCPGKDEECRPNHVTYAWESVESLQECRMG